MGNSAMFLVFAPFPEDESLGSLSGSRFFFSFFSVFGVLVATTEPSSVIIVFSSRLPGFYRETFAADGGYSFHLAAFLGGAQGVVDGVDFGLGFGGRGGFEGGVAPGGFGARVAFGGAGAFLRGAQIVLGI